MSQPSTSARPDVSPRRLSDRLKTLLLSLPPLSRGNSEETALSLVKTPIIDESLPEITVQSPDEMHFPGYLKMDSPTALARFPGQNFSGLLTPPLAVHKLEGSATITENREGIYQATRRKALLIGINYGRDVKLGGCHKDVENMKQFLCDHFAWEDHHFTILKDDGIHPDTQPTRTNMIHQMKRLVSEAQPGDHLFFHFSGHGRQIEDLDGDEIDMLDEVIISSDLYDVVDDEMHEILVKPLPEGCRLTAIFDSCTSGTGLDLPNHPPPSPLAFGMPGALSTGALDLPHNYDSRPTSPASGRTSPMNGSSRRNSTEALAPGRRKHSKGTVIMWSACQDSELSHEVVARDRTMRGAMTHAFIESLKDTRKQTYQQLLDSISEILNVWGCPQRPQLSSAQHIRMSEQFLL